MKKIVTLLSKNLSVRCKNQMSIDLSLTAALKEYLVKNFSDAKMGARPLKRALQTEVEDALSEEILAGNIKEGDKVSATVHDKKVLFKKTEG